MIELLKKVGGVVVDLVYPQICLLCGVDIGCKAGAPAAVMCADCVATFQMIEPPYCDRCGEPIKANRVVCRRCEDGPAPAYDWSYAPYQYSGPLMRAVHRLKYDRKVPLAEPLGKLLANSLHTSNAGSKHLYDTNRDANSPAWDLIVPVPLHSSRMRSRGFNQAEILARVVADSLEGVKLATNLVRRVKRTTTQTAMNPAMRLNNVRGAFQVVSPEQLELKSVLIIDDVLTSTSTARELARVIAVAGASRVAVLALARSI